MMRALAAVPILALAAAGCVSPGTSEDFKWSIDCPKTVDKGSEFALVVKTEKTEKTMEKTEEGEKEKSSVVAIEGVEFSYQIHWTGGSSAPLRHKGRTGESLKVRARLVPGPATILVTSLNKEGLDVKVLEATVEVK